MFKDIIKFEHVKVFRHYINIMIEPLERTTTICSTRSGPGFYNKKVYLTLHSRNYWNLGRPTLTHLICWQSLIAACFPMWNAMQICWYHGERSSSWTELRHFFLRGKCACNLLLIKSSEPMKLRLDTTTAIFDCNLWNDFKQYIPQNPLTISFVIEKALHIIFKLQIELQPYLHSTTLFPSGSIIYVHQRAKNRFETLREYLDCIFPTYVSLLLSMPRSRPSQQQCMLSRCTSLFSMMMWRCGPTILPKTSHHCHNSMPCAGHLSSRTIATHLAVFGSLSG